MRTDVTFESQGTPLSGHLYLPDQNPTDTQRAAVIVTGAWTTVKEQMPATYAEALSQRGLIVLSFDFRGWGASSDSDSFLEHPERKTQDILAAAEFLASRPEVDTHRIAGLGICASSGYMSDAALASSHIRSLALVAPWLHDAAIVEAVYGGKEGVASLMTKGKEAAASEQPVCIEAASMEHEEALMYQAPYYTEPERGLIPEYDNKFNVASWEPWLRYDALQTPKSLTKPVLLVHSESAAIPQGAKKYVALAGENVRIHWLDEVTQFDFYDKTDVVATAADAVAHHFHSTMRSADQQLAIDTLKIQTVIESVGLLADTHQFESLEKLYADEVEVDYTSLTGGEVETKSPQSLMTQWASVLPGFDATRHQISHVHIRIEGASAEATCKVEAVHLVDDLRWTVNGAYHYKLTKTGKDWSIHSHQFQLSEEEGSREVFARAAANAALHPSPYMVRQATQSAVRNFLESLEEKDMSNFAKVWAKDAVQHMPYAPEGFPERVAGKENILNHYSGWPANAGAADFTSELVFYPMKDPEMIFAEFKGKVDVVPTHRRYEQSYGGLFHVDQGQITLFREYFNPGPFVKAFGLDEGGEFHSKQEPTS